MRPQSLLFILLKVSLLFLTHVMDNLSPCCLTHPTRLFLKREKLLLVTAEAACKVTTCSAGAIRGSVSRRGDCSSNIVTNTRPLLRLSRGICGVVILYSTSQLLTYFLRLESDLTVFGLSFLTSLFWFLCVTCELTRPVSLLPWESTGRSAALIRNNRLSLLNDMTRIRCGLFFKITFKKKKKPMCCLIPVLLIWVYVWSTQRHLTAY